MLELYVFFSFHGFRRGHDFESFRVQAFSTSVLLFLVSVVWAFPLFWSVPVVFLSAFLAIYRLACSNAFSVGQTSPLVLEATRVFFFSLTFRRSIPFVL